MAGMTENIKKFAGPIGAYVQNRNVDADTLSHAIETITQLTPDEIDTVSRAFQKGVEADPAIDEFIQFLGDNLAHIQSFAKSGQMHEGDIGELVGAGLRAVSSTGRNSLVAADEFRLKFNEIADRNPGAAGTFLARLKEDSLSANHPLREALEIFRNTYPDRKGAVETGVSFASIELPEGLASFQAQHAEDVSPAGVPGSGAPKQIG